MAIDQQAIYGTHHLVKWYRASHVIVLLSLAVVHNPRVLNNFFYQAWLNISFHFHLIFI